MNIRKILLIGMFCLTGPITFAALNTRIPQIGYLYPAGGQKGTVVRITAGGQFLNGAEKVYITGEGVKADVIEYFRPIGNLNKERRQLLDDRFEKVLNKRISELPSNIRQKIIAERKPARKNRPAQRNNAVKKNAANEKNNIKATTDNNKTTAGKNAAEKNPENKKQQNSFFYQMPAHPLLVDLENKSIRELEHIRSMIYMPNNKLQPNRQLAETVMIEITISPNAKPGNRELRIQTKNGLSNPIVFQVGSYPEKYEVEPNNRTAYEPIRRMKALPEPGAIEIPAVLNGQIMPGDVDRFRFHAEKGQKLVIETHARSLIPYLADAVPGWFQSTIALYRASGKEVAFADDYRFNPDPVLFYDIKITGDYELEIRDSLYRGRQDFVYRIIVGDKPFITEMFPLGARAGSTVFAQIKGWNIRDNKLKLDTSFDGHEIRYAAAEYNGCVSNPMAYAVNEYPECTENNSNDNIYNAQKITLPMIINGLIEKPGDIDVFKFAGRRGDEIVAEVNARRLNSPLDSFIKLTDSRGVSVKWNDDYVIKENHLHKDITGLITHHADSRLVTELPDDGNYYVFISDTQNHGGKAYSYRLRLCKRQGDFALRVTPSSLFMKPGESLPLRMHLLRKDGFNGPVELSLKDAPEGFEISGGRIPAGTDKIDFTLKAPSTVSESVFSLDFQGKAEIGGKDIIRPAMPAEDCMQAFLYRHLVPSQQFSVAVMKRKWQFPDIKLAGDRIIRINADDSAQVVFRARGKKSWIPKNFKLRLYDAPEGLNISDVKAQGKEISFVLNPDKQILKNGFEGNILLEAYREFFPKNKNGKPLKVKTTASFGVLPAIPVIIARAN